MTTVQQKGFEGGGKEKKCLKLPVIVDLKVGFTSALPLKLKHVGWQSQPRTIGLAT